MKHILHTFHLIVSGFRLFRAQIFEGTAIDLGETRDICRRMIAWSYLEGEQMNLKQKMIFDVDLRDHKRCCERDIGQCQCLIVDENIPA